ncbi:hypothetical protein Goklo_007653, partial [Gossypium klotzschianum]|nr:hypothetical protein [Gossypium klotzschianum]
ITKHQDIKTVIVCHILDVTREVVAGVTSVEAIEMFLTLEWIQQFKNTIHFALLLMVDANLSPPALEVSCQRAGDCLVGGMLASLSTGLDMMQNVAIGIAAAKASVEVDSNVPSQFSLPTITGDVMIVYSAAKLLQPQSKLYCPKKGITESFRLSTEVSYLSRNVNVLYNATYL